MVGVPPYASFHTTWGLPPELTISYPVSCWREKWAVQDFSRDGASRQRTTFVILYRQFRDSSSIVLPTHLSFLVPDCR